MEISTGMMLPRWLSVAALYCLTKSMMFTPCGPSAVPTGGAGVAWPAGSCTLTTAASFFLLGGIEVCPYLYGFLDLGHLVERKLDRSLAAEDRHQHLELLGVGVDLVHGGGKRGERAVHYGNALADLEFHLGRTRGLGLLGARLGLRREQAGNLAELQRRRPAGQADETGHTGGVADDRPGFVGEVHSDQDVAGQHLLLDLLPLAALDLGHLLHRDLDLEDVVLHVERLDAALQVGLHPVLVTRVGVHHVPVARKHAEFALELLARVVRLLLFFFGVFLDVRLEAVVGRCGVSGLGRGIEPAGFLAVFAHVISLPGFRVGSCRVRRHRLGLGHDYSLFPWCRLIWPCSSGRLAAPAGNRLAEQREYQLGEAVVQARDEDDHEGHEDQADHGVGDQHRPGGPDYLAKLADHLPEEQGGGGPGLALGRASASAPFLRGLTTCLSCHTLTYTSAGLAVSPDRTRRAGGTRTPNHRFWRPGLWPIELLPCASSHTTWVQITCPLTNGHAAATTARLPVHAVYVRTALPSNRLARGVRG